MPADFHYDSYYWVFNPQQMSIIASFILPISTAFLSSAFLSAELSTVSTCYAAHGTCTTMQNVVGLDDPEALLQPKPF